MIMMPYCRPGHGCSSHGTQPSGTPQVARVLAGPRRRARPARPQPGRAWRVGHPARCHGDTPRPIQTAAGRVAVQVLRLRLRALSRVTEGNTLH